MTTMTATDVARNLSAVLDAVANGETVLAIDSAANWNDLPDVTAVFPR